MQVQYIHMACCVAALWWEYPQQQQQCNYQCSGKGGGSPTLTRSGREKHASSRNAINTRDLMDDDEPSSALEAFKALHHPERKAAESLLITYYRTQD